MSESYTAAPRASTPSGSAGHDPDPHAPDNDRPLSSLKTITAVFTALLARGFWPVGLYPRGVKRRGVMTEGKEPFGPKWGLIRWTIEKWKQLLDLFPEAGCGLCLGPGRGPDGKWLIDAEGDGPEAEESRARLFGGEMISTLGWGSVRGGHQLFTADGDRLKAIVARLKPFQVKVQNQLGVFHIPTLPGLELRFGGYKDDGTVKQLQSVVPPTPGTDGKPRVWNGVDTIADVPESFYAGLEAAVEAATADQPAPLLDQAEESGRSGGMKFTVPPATDRPDAWLKAGLSNAYGKVALASTGQRHAMVLSQTRTLAGFLHYREKHGIGFSEAELADVMVRAANEAAPERAADNPRCVRDAIDNGKARPLYMPDELHKLATGAQDTRRNGDGKAHQATAGPSADGDGHHEGASTAGPKPSGNGKGHREVPADPYAGATAEELGIVDADDVELENPEWLWEHRFLMGKINLIAGEGGDGKTTVAILVGSVVTVGGTFPDGKPAGEAGCVVVLAAEDGAGDTIKPRFIAAGGETSNGRLKFLTAQVSIPKKGDTPAMVHPVCLQDIGYWRATFTLLRPRVILIDPLPAYLGRGINDHKNSEVQAALKEFAALAKEFNVCVIAITHTGKSVERKLIHRVIGSVAYTNVSRVVHVTIRDPDDKNIRYLERPKCNLDEPRDALVYHLVPVEFERDGVTYKTTKAVFEAETVAIDAEAMVNPRKDGEPRRERDPKKETLAAEWLFDFLDGNPGGIAQRDVFQAAGEAGHIGTFDKIKRRWSSGTKLYRALDRLPSLETPRDGRVVERQDLASVSDRYPRIYWRLVDTRNDDADVPF